MTPDFTKYPDGLVPAIIQDNSTGKVLMLGYMNEEALRKTEGDGKVVFYSRSKNRLWQKGETSGNYLRVDGIRIDCDRDCLLIKATPSGPVSHTGADTCFNERNIQNNFLQQLEGIIRDRKQNPEPGSYTSALFAGGINKAAQKVGEEAVELIIEAKEDNKESFVNEAADLLFHYLVLLEAKNCSLKEVAEVLEKRSSRHRDAGSGADVASPP